MEKLILLLSLVLIFSGCVGNNMHYMRFDEYGNKLEDISISNLGGMNNAKTKNFKFKVSTKSELEIEVIFEGREVVHSPESGKVLMDGGANIVTGGAAGAVDNLTK